MNRPRRQRGNTLIEFAGALLLISTMFTGMFQFGYSLYSYNRLVNAVLEGARYASMQPPGSVNTNPDLPKTVQNMVVYGDPEPRLGAQPVISGLGVKNVQLISDAKTITVAIRDFRIDGLFSRLSLDGKPTVTFPCTKR